MDEVKKPLQEQLQLLLKRSSNPDTTATELVSLTYAMVSLSLLLVPEWTRQKISNDLSCKLQDTLERLERRASILTDYE